VQDTDFTKILGWPGYRVFQHEINEGAKTLRLWVRRKRRRRPLICSGCGARVRDVVDVREREVRDLPWGEYRTTVVVEVFRVRCPDCGVRWNVSRSCRAKPRSASDSRTPWAGVRGGVGAAGGAAFRPRPVRWALDLRYLTRWAAERRRPALKQMGVDGSGWKRTKFLRSSAI
jgi:hypothetical protein